MRRREHTFVITLTITWAAGRWPSLPSSEPALRRSACGDLQSRASSDSCGVASRCGPSRRDGSANGPALRATIPNAGLWFGSTGILGGASSDLLRSRQLPPEGPGRAPSGASPGLHGRRRRRSVHRDGGAPFTASRERSVADGDVLMTGGLSDLSDLQRHSSRTRGTPSCTAKCEPRKARAIRTARQLGPRP